MITNKNTIREKVDVCVVGAGHAGCEAALACARLGLETVIFTVSVDSIALMPCNPNVGGSSKGHLVRELDALGGEMGKNIDKTFIQSKMLNVSKGPAVHSLRAQADKAEYSRAMRKVLENQEHLTIRQAEVCNLLWEEVQNADPNGYSKKIIGVQTFTGAVYECRAVVLCTGTYLKARCLCGEAITYTGPNGLQAANYLTDSLKEMGIELMVSIWPMVDYKSENFQEMKAKGLLTRVEKGVRIDNTYMGNTIQYDPTNPEAREYVWGKVKKNYYDKGIKIFWLDEAEPEYTVYDFENYRYHAGPNVQVGNIYPVMYAKTFFDGMREAGQEQVVNLVRCAWAGSQKYGNVVWSGDVPSTFESFQNQFAAGLNMAIAGIPWWTTDIGGFFGANIYDKAYHEVFVRWFEYGTFCPVMRLHGDRMPHQPQHGTTGGAACVSGAPNEIWSYGEEVYEICKKYIRIRENMRPYTRALMQAAHEKGTPVICYHLAGTERSTESELEK